MSVSEIAILILIVLPMIAIWLYVMVDAIRRDDLSATRKIVWILAALIVPLITIMLYLLTRPRRVPPGAVEGRHRRSGRGAAAPA